MSLPKIFITLAIISVLNVNCLRKLYCDTQDEECLTKAVNERLLPKLIEGMPGIEPSEPLIIHTLEINLPNLKLFLRNATITGVKDCVAQVKKNGENFFEYEPCCPHLTLETEFETEGHINAVSVKGKGTFKNTYENLTIKVVGQQEKVKYVDCKDHIRILNYTMQFNLQGKSTYDYKNLTFGEIGRCKCNSDAAKSNYYDRFEEITRRPILEAFMKKIMDNYEDFNLVTPMDEIYYIYV